MPPLAVTIANDRQALLSVFKARTVDARHPEGGIERCDVSIEDQADKVKCRMVVKMICRNGSSVWLVVHENG